MASPYVPYEGEIVTRGDALAAGLTRFYTGKPCVRGHLSQRTSCNGGCIRCNQTDGLALYHAESQDARKARNARTREWKDANREQVRAEGRKYSKEHREQANAWKAANRDKTNAASRAAHKLNPDVMNDRVRRYLASKKGKAARAAHYEANRERLIQKAAEWKARNPDRALELRRSHYEANKDTITQRVREWNEANPGRSRVRGRNYRARLFDAEGSHTHAEIMALFAKQGGRCVYCRKAMGDKFEADHIKPLARGGSNWIANIQLTCRKCNNQKRATDPAEYARRIGLLL